MTAPRASMAMPAHAARLLRWAVLPVAILLLAACAENQQKPSQASTSSQPQPHSTRKPWKPLGSYTAGGLYAPGVSDGAPDVPPDIANLPEPVPHPEPLSRYGNRSPYFVLGKTYSVLPSATGYVERGMASWYGTKFDGRVTSSFEPYDLSQFSAAHRTLPLPSYARVTNLENGRSVIVRINDRGPFHEGRLIDLSYAAAIKLGVNVHGTAMVEVRGIDTSQMPSPAQTEKAAATVSATHAPSATPKPAVRHPDPRPSPVAAVAATSQATPPPTVPAPPAAVVSQMADPTIKAAGPVPSSPAATVPPATAFAAQPEPPATTTPTAATALPAPLITAAVPIVSSPLAPAPNTSAPLASAPVDTVPTTSASSSIPVAPVAASVLLPPPSSAAALPAIAQPAPAPVGAPANMAPSVPLMGRPGVDASTVGFLQLASFGDRGNAERMLQKLQQAGIEHVELISIQVADQTWWRVHIGPIRADESERLAARLDALGFGTPPFFKE